jgi:predicted ATPase/transcriptional regulator with XRE-family HTH domain
MSPAQSFGHWLRQRRRALDLTQAELARRAACAPITIRKLEADQSRPSRQLAEILAEQLAIPLDERDAFVRFARADHQDGYVSPDVPPPKPTANRINNLPPQSAQFVGRERELGQIADLLENPDCRLLTLVGYGGMGKTRLAIQAAAVQLEQFAHGVYFVPLDALTAGEFIAPALATTLKLPLSAGSSPLTQVISYLRGKQALLVLDCFEHLIESALLVSEVLQGCAQVKLLVTSRERLNLLEEWVLPVSGMPIPPEAFTNDDEPASALALFTQRARRVRSDFAITRENYPAIRRICQLVDGMPLGIELAAAGVKLLLPQEIAREIEQSRAIPSTALRNLPARQRSLRAVFDYGWNRLSQEQRRVLAQLAIFRGGFRREAAATVADAALDTLSALVDQSLLNVTLVGRYEQHPLVYQYAQEKLAQSPGERVRAAERHARYYAGFVHTRATDVKSVRQAEAMYELDEELENVRAMWQWALEQRDVAVFAQTISTLSIYFEIRGLFEEGARLFRQAAEMLQALEPSEARDAALGNALSQQAGMGFWSRPMEEAVRFSREAIELLRCTTARAEYALALLWHGLIKWRVGDYAVAQTQYEQSLAVYRELHDDWGMAWDLGLLGFLDTLAFDERAHLLRQSITMFRTLGTQHELGIICNGLGLLYLEVGNFTDAQNVLHEAAQVRQVYDRKFLPYTLNNLARAALGAGDLNEAQRVWEDALAAGREQNDVDTIASSLIGFGEVALARREPATAETFLKEGLDAARQIGIQFTLLRGCIAFADLLAQQSHPERAVEILSVMLKQPALEPIYREKAMQLLSNVEPELSSEILAAARVRVEGCTPEDVVAELLGHPDP